MDHRARQRREWPAIEAHLPPRARRASLALLETLPIVVRVTRPRRSKHGDHRLSQCGKFHEITVRVKRPGAQVRARKGYYALKTKPVVEPDVLHQLLTSPMALPGLTMRASSTVLASSADLSSLRTLRPSANRANSWGAARSRMAST